MPRTYNGLFEQIVSYENLVGAYLDARRHKRKKGDVIRVHENWPDVLLSIKDEIEAGVWSPRPFHTFLAKRERKTRQIEAPAFRDRIVHHAICRVLSPVFERKMIHDSYSCRVGKGGHAVERANSMLQAARREYRSVYVLQCDISKFFPSIVHGILLGIMSRTVRERRVLELCRRAMANPANKTGCGLPIGALTSQLLSNIYMTPFDHHIKDTLGVRYYVRYADDFFLLADNKAKLWELRGNIENFVWDKLRMELNPKTRIFPASQGLDFCGYRIWADKILPRKINVTNAKKRFKALSRLYSEGRASVGECEAAVAAFLGYAKRCSSKESVISALYRLQLTKGRVHGNEGFNLQDWRNFIQQGNTL